MERNISSKVEQLVYDAIDDLADELEIDCNVYPEVYYLHKNFSFSELGLSEREKKAFDIIKKRCNGMYLRNPKIILLPTQDIAEIYEEAGHFLHFNSSSLNFSGGNKYDKLFMNTIIEAIGYFCSKFGDSNRTPFFGDYPDFFKEREKCLKIINSQNFDFNDFFVYQQGYGIGEELFNHYISGLVSKEKIRTLISENFDGEHEATDRFIKLRSFLSSSFLVESGLKKFS